jgi:hypothetical protein
MALAPAKGDVSGSDTDAVRAACRALFREIQEKIDMDEDEVLTCGVLRIRRTPAHRSHWTPRPVFPSRCPASLSAPRSERAPSHGRTSWVELTVRLAHRLEGQGRHKLAASYFLYCVDKASQAGPRAARCTTSANARIHRQCASDEKLDHDPSDFLARALSSMAKLCERQGNCALPAPRHPRCRRPRTPRADEQAVHYRRAEQMVPTRDAPSRLR